MALSTEKKVGVFFLLTLLLLGGFIELVEDWRPFETQLDYKTYFNSAVGIKMGDPVRMAGVEVGKIRNISIEDSKVRIDFYVVDGTFIKSDAIARISRTNLLGGQFLGLDFGTETAETLPSGSTVPSEDGVSIDQLINNFDRNQERVLGKIGDLIDESMGPLVDAIKELESVIRKIDEGEGVLGRLVNEPELYDELSGAVGNLNAILKRLEKGEGSLGKLLNDPALYDDLTATVSNLKELTGDLKSGQGTLGKLFVEDDLYVNASDALANIRDISDKANNGKGSLGRLINDEDLYEEVHGTMKRINSIAAKIDEGQGTLGRLVNEDDLYREAKTTLHKVEKTVDGMADTGPISALGVVLGTHF